MDFSLVMSLNMKEFLFGLGKTSSFTYYVGTRLIEMRPKQLHPANNLLKSFDYYTWTLLAMSLICISIALYIIPFIESKVSVLQIQWIPLNRDRFLQPKISQLTENPNYPKYLMYCYVVNGFPISIPINRKSPLSESRLTKIYCILLSFHFIYIE